MKYICNFMYTLVEIMGEAEAEAYTSLFEV